MNSKIPVLMASTAMAVSLLAFTSPASAIIVNSTVPTWGGAVGGTNVSTNLSNGAYTDVRWGTPAGSGAKSGLGFDPVNPPPVDEPLNTPFLLGTLRHYNNPINAGGAPVSVNLNLLTTFQGTTPATQTFSYKFLVDETPNVTPCAYPSSTPCADRITFQNLDTTKGFAYLGNSYTISLSGFSTNGGATFTTDFISQENATNSAGLYGVIRLATPVPEPASLALLGAGLVGLGGLRRLRSKR